MRPRDLYCFGASPDIMEINYEFRPNNKTRIKRPKRIVPGVRFVHIKNWPVLFIVRSMIRDVICLNVFSNFVKKKK